MVLDHVAQGAGPLVVVRAALDADRLGGRDLHVIDVAPVPHRLEHAVREPEDQQVLNGLLPEIVIDAEDLGFVEMRMEQVVERARAREIGAERLLDDDPAPLAAPGPGQARGAELLRDGAVDGRRESRGRRAPRSARRAPSDRRPAVGTAPGRPSLPARMPCRARARTTRRRAWRRRRTPSGCREIAGGTRRRSSATARRRPPGSAPAAAGRVTGDTARAAACAA